MNSPVISQTIINEILWNLINTREVASFINDVIVEIKEEDGYNEIIEEVIRRLVENDLYMKPEKYKQKIKKVEFLGIVIGLEKVKIEKEKVQRVLDWLTLKGVKDGTYQLLLVVH